MKWVNNGNWKHLRQGQSHATPNMEDCVGLVEEADSQLENKGHTSKVLISCEHCHMINMAVNTL